ncbi:Asp-tRNA(Asn)/Glu-tRNA(Gln) amidotransferase subunit GatB [Candidatus Leptofilum sp.]|uniref:Asp-tRNA(Asn)/Glu-tRNA(Gln) amidotransferase subunit GatB n=1 Tax=Candidatus Leptofilum sp. TaxID=3241576 RepID=UPI003B5AC511
MTQYEPVIGLEIHAELMTESKMFSKAKVVDSVEAAPNTAVSPLCLGMPGTLPVINQKAVEYALRVALALNCEINHHNIFARKNYFYPDLPKGYQISQYEQPLGVNGWLDIELESGETKRIGIRRVHMEEDTGKLTHQDDGTSLVDYNRAGVPLLEIVTEPDIRSGEEARAYAMKVRQILRYLGVNSGDMEKGVLRVEPNISIRPVGSREFGTRTELKNLNSFRVLADGTAYEIERQTAVLQSGGTVIQETRGWHEGRRETFSQRTKEEAEDYRYFPEPDLPPLHLDDAWIEEVRTSLPELPDAKIARYQAKYGLSDYDSRVLAEERAVGEWFDTAVAAGGAPKAVANWMINELFRLMNEAKLGIDAIQVTPAALVELIGLVEKQTINNNTAKEVLAEMFSSGAAPTQIVEAKGLAQISDDAAIQAIIEQILDDNPEQVARYLDGQTKLRGFFIGQVMRQTKGKANPGLVNKLLDVTLNGRH